MPTISALIVGPRKREITLCQRSFPGRLEHDRKSASCTFAQPQPLRPLLLRPRTPVDRRRSRSLQKRERLGTFRSLTGTSGNAARYKRPPEKRCLAAARARRKARWARRDSCAVCLEPIKINTHTPRLQMVTHLFPLLVRTCSSKRQPFSLRAHAGAQRRRLRSSGEPRQRACLVPSEKVNAFIATRVFH